jgi:hypothetical protein
MTTATDQPELDPDDDPDIGRSTRALLFPTLINAVEMT